jgi:hypothetical protein
MCGEGHESMLHAVTASGTQAKGAIREEMKLVSADRYNLMHTAK